MTYIRPVIEIPEMSFGSEREMTNFHLALEQVFLVWKFAIEAEEFLFFWIERLQDVSGLKPSEVEMSYTYVNFVLLMWIHLA